MNDAMFGLIGVIVGFLGSFITTIITNKHSERMDRERRKHEIVIENHQKKGPLCMELARYLGNIEPPTGYILAVATTWEEKSFAKIRLDEYHQEIYALANYVSEHIGEMELLLDSETVHILKDFSYFCCHKTGYGSVENSCPAEIDKAFLTINADLLKCKARLKSEFAS